MKEIVLIGIVWIGFGSIGYLMDRQGFLVKYEKFLGKEESWHFNDICWGVMGAIFLGPIYIIVPWKIHGKNCFKKRDRE